MARWAALVVLACCAAFIEDVTPAGLSAPHASTLDRLVPPPDGQAYFGFTYRIEDLTDPVYGDSRPFEMRIRESIQNELAGKTPTFIKVWTPWQNPGVAGKPFIPFSDTLPSIRKVEGVVGDRGIVALDWNLGLATAANGGITIRDVESGRIDGYIESYARAVKLYGRPILITLFGGEFNGDWFYAASPRANSMLSTHDLVRAWRRVVDIFNAVGVRNASWAWIVNGYPTDRTAQPQIDRNIDSYYPGDGYVDWVGVDFYDVGLPNWVDGPYAFAVAHAKPVFIGEFGIRHEWSSLTPTSDAQRAWLGGAFDYFESHAAIKAISYFNYNNRAASTRVKWDPARAVYLAGGAVNYVPNVNDHDHRLLAGGPEVQALFAQRISSPRYVSSISTEIVSVPDNPPVVQARAARGQLGATVPLRFTVFDDAGEANAIVKIYRGPQVVQTVRLDFAPVAAVTMRTVRWRAPKKQSGKPKRQFCVRSADRSGHMSATSCAPITLRSSKQGLLRR